MNAVAVDTKEIQQETTNIVTVARGLVVASDEQFTHAGGVLQRIAKARRAVKETFDPSIKAAHETHKKVLAAKALHEKPLESAEKYLRNIMGAYQHQKEQEARRIQAEQDKKRREEEEARRIEEAQAMEDSGRHEEAEAMVSAPVRVAPAPVQAAPKVEGVSFRETWKFRVVNPALVPREYLEIDEKKIGGVVRALKGEARIPGIEAYSEKSTNVRGI